MVKRKVYGSKSQRRKAYQKRKQTAIGNKYKPSVKDDQRINKWMTDRTAYVVRRLRLGLRIPAPEKYALQGGESPKILNVPQPELEAPQPGTSHMLNPLPSTSTPLSMFLLRRNIAEQLEANPLGLNCGKEADRVCQQIADEERIANNLLFQDKKSVQRLQRAHRQWLKDVKVRADRLHTHNAGKYADREKEIHALDLRHADIMAQHARQVADINQRMVWRLDESRTRMDANNVAIDAKLKRMQHVQKQYEADFAITEARQAKTLQNMESAGLI